MDVMTRIDIPHATKRSSGKVREIFDTGGDELVIVTTDRISAFDVVLPDPIPSKGHVLNQLSLFWFNKTASLVTNHVLSSNVSDYPEAFRDDPKLRGRSMLVKKATALPVECIVRGYLSGSGWKEYCQSGSLSGISLPGGLRESDRLPEPIFTPSTKAEIGQHDENIDMKTAADLVGGDLIEEVKEVSLKIYTMASEYALEKGIIIADTKFEFGLINESLVFIDEAITPDSSRFWLKKTYVPGGPQASFDKQFVRDYLETLDWDKTPPGPTLPEEIIAKTSAKYLAAFEMLTGTALKMG
ncbi:MAG: phosphoribosylaminoimidazolesuccinocarboxamide synthase [Desulfomonilia bacterium]|nr:phosphoribosylaminoimidazolesuccinocarboxamide synthase [Desulfomonilia bacterium]